MKEELVYLGVDIAKSHLDGAVGLEKKRFSNDAVGHRELIGWVRQIKTPIQVICESSGGYERRFVQAVARAQIKISLVQANRVRQFARAAGILVKTDQIDAEVLCEFGRVFLQRNMNMRSSSLNGLTQIIHTIKATSPA